MKKIRVKKGLSIVIVGMMVFLLILSAITIIPESADASSSPVKEKVLILYDSYNYNGEVDFGTWDDKNSNTHRAGYWYSQTWLKSHQIYYDMCDSNSTDITDELLSNYKAIIFIYYGAHDTTKDIQGDISTAEWDILENAINNESKYLTSLNTKLGNTGGAHLGKSQHYVDVAAGGYSPIFLKDGEEYFNLSNDCLQSPYVYNISKLENDINPINSSDNETFIFAYEWHNRSVWYCTYNPILYDYAMHYTCQKAGISYTFTQTSYDIDDVSGGEVSNATVVEDFADVSDWWINGHLDFSTDNNYGHLTVYSDSANDYIQKNFTAKNWTDDWHNALHLSIGSTETSSIRIIISDGTNEAWYTLSLEKTSPSYSYCYDYTIPLSSMNNIGSVDRSAITNISFKIIDAKSMIFYFEMLYSCLLSADLEDMQYFVNVLKEQKIVTTLAIEAARLFDIHDFLSPKYPWSGYEGSYIDSSQYSVFLDLLLENQEIMIPTQHGLRQEDFGHDWNYSYCKQMHDLAIYNLESHGFDIDSSNHLIMIPPGHFRNENSTQMWSEYGLKYIAGTPDKTIENGMDIITRKDVTRGATYETSKLLLGTPTKSDRSVDFNILAHYDEKAWLYGFSDTRLKEGKGIYGHERVDFGCERIGQEGMKLVGQFKNLIGGTEIIPFYLHANHIMAEPTFTFYDNKISISTNDSLVGYHLYVSNISTAKIGNEYIISYDDDSNTLILPEIPSGETTIEIVRGDWDVNIPQLKYQYPIYNLLERATYDNTANKINYKHYGADNTSITLDLTSSFNYTNTYIYNNDEGVWENTTKDISKPLKLSFEAKANTDYSIRKMSIEIIPTNIVDVRILTYDLTKKDVYDETTISFKGRSTDGEDVIFKIGELELDTIYQIKKDGILYQKIRSNSTGFITFNNSDWSNHTFTISNADMGSMINPLMGIILTVMIMVSIIGMIGKFGKGK